MIKFGICEWAAPIQGPYVFKLAQELGLDGVEISQGDYERALPTSNPWIQNAYLSQAHIHDIEISAIAVNSIDNHPMTAPKGDPECNIVSLCIREAIKTAANMHIPIVQIPSFFKSDINCEADFEMVSYHLKNACQFAEKHGIIIGTENALSAQQNLDLIHAVDMSNLKVYFDTQNPSYMRGYSAPEMIYALSDSICEVHVKDGKHGELSGSLLGEGCSEFFSSVHALRDIHYSGYIVLENYYDRAPMNHCDKDALALLKQDIQIMKAAFA